MRVNRLLRQLSLSYLLHIVYLPFPFSSIHSPFSPRVWLAEFCARLASLCPYHRNRPHFATPGCDLRTTTDLEGCLTPHHTPLGGGGEPPQRHKDLLRARHQGEGGRGPHSAKRMRMEDEDEGGCRRFNRRRKGLFSSRHWRRCRRHD